METDYDVAGRVSKTTQAYAASADSLCSGTCLGTTYAYDALSRPTLVTDAAGGTVAYGYTMSDVLQTIAPAPSGENRKQKQLEYDGLGRLTSVCEVTSGSGNGSCAQSNALTGFWTTYAYNQLSNLILVTQNAQAAVGSRQTRSYTFDQLGRMTSETNPESGTTTHVYDITTIADSCGSSGRTSPGDLVQKKDANGVTTCYIYDSLHRVTDIGNTIENSSNPCKRFRYDNSNGVTGTRPTGVTVSNSLGRLVEAETDNCSAWPPTPIADEWFSYDKRGQVTDVYELTPHSGAYYHVTQSYWQHGAPKALSGLPGLPTITYGATDGSGLDGEGRVTKITASTGVNPLTGATYVVSGTTQPIGAITQLTLGSADTDNFSYDPHTGRMTQYKFNIGSAPQSVVGNLTWNANGSLRTLAITDPSMRPMPRPALSHTMTWPGKPPRIAVLHGTRPFHLIRSETPVKARL